MLAPLVFAAAQVVLWHSYRAEEQRALDACVATWNRAHPDAGVEALALPYDGYAAKLEAAIPRGNGPDLFIGPHGSIGEWSLLHLVEPIENRLPAATPGAPGRDSLDGDFLDGTVEPLRHDGHLYGLPLAFKSVALFYRRDLLAAPPRTTDDLLAQMRAAHQAGRYGLAYEAGDFFFHAAWLHGFGGRILDEHGAPALDSDPAVAALQLVADLAPLLPAESTSV